MATWGRPKIEGRIFCEQYEIRIHVVEIQEDGAINRYIIDKTGETEAFNPEIDYSDPKILHIVNYHNHYVPLLRANIPAKQIQDVAVNYVEEQSKIAAETVTHVYHRPGRDTHFELMAETSQPLYSLLPASPLVSQTMISSTTASPNVTERRKLKLDEESDTDQEKHADKKLAHACVEQGIFSPPVIAPIPPHRQGSAQAMDVDSLNSPENHGSCEVSR